jgi:DNA-binding MarR family transcriptional regulator
MDKVAQLDTAITTLLRVLVIQERRISNGNVAVPFNPLDLETLSFLGRHQNAVAKEIATYLHVSATTMQSVIDRLEKRGFIIKDKSALKGRAVAISLTTSGKEFRDLMQAHNIQNCEAMLSAINVLDQDRFVDSMAKIAAKFAQGN